MVGRRLGWAAIALLSAARGVHGGFFVCPDDCEALVLPRDMESLDDCLCPPGSLRYQDEPDEDDATGVFTCKGRYKPRDDDPRSVADCDCQLPYEKDGSTGACVLRECPRAGNYMRKRSSRGAITSLVDCECMSPFVKDPPSGECVPAASDYECPPHSTVDTSGHQYPHRHRQRKPKSFADCNCDWGFVRTATGQCERETAVYACPAHASKSPDLAPGEYPLGFFDCECDTKGYIRNDRTETCDKRRTPGDDSGADDEEYTDDEDFECPPYSRPLAPTPHSLEQCACLPGYGWKIPEMTCVRMSAYSCPAHSHFNPDRRSDRDGRAKAEVAASFADCDCARGYVRDEDRDQCLAWFLRDGNACPAYAVLTHWPLKSSGNCECVYGFKDDISEDEEEDGDGEDTDKKKKKKAKECRSSPMEDEDDDTKKQPPSCPARSFAVYWPVRTVAADCECLFGYERSARTKKNADEEDDGSFRCVPSDEVDLDEHAAKCRAPLVMNPLTGGCHYPMEDVKATTADLIIPDEDDEDGFEDRNVIVLNGVEYDYVMTEDNILVIQGDVAIGERLTWPDSKGNSNSHVVLHGYYNAERDHRWKDATMCFQIDSSAKSMERTVLDAMKHISNVSGFKFRRCTDDSCSNMATNGADSTSAMCAHDYINFKATKSSCFSYIGRIGGAQTLGVSADCGLGNLMHVVLHAMGLRHAIDRPDRDEHVRIAWECIPEHKRSFFLVEDESQGKETAGDDEDVPATLQDEPYDFYSIMHHTTSAFVHDEDTTGRWRPKWCQSIVPLIEDDEERRTVMGLMGQRALLTLTDIHSIWRIYPSLHRGDTTPRVADAVDQQARNGVVDVTRVHESKLHDPTSDTVDAAELSTASKKSSSFRNFVKRATSFLGAVATLCGFGAFMAFAVMEARKRAMQVRSGGDAYYAELLLSEKGGLND